MVLRKHGIRIGLGLLVVLFFLAHASDVIRLRFFHQIEAFAYDLRLNLTMPRTVDPRVVIVDIDEKSLAEEGRWPWSRNKLGLLMDRLFDDYKVAVVGFDVVFAERDESSGLKVLERLSKNEFKGDGQYRDTLERIRGRLDYDALFAKDMKGRPIVLGYYFTHNDDPAKIRTSGVLPEPVFPASAFEGEHIPFIVMNGYGGNLPEFQKNAASAGHFNPFPDFDGVTRRVPMLMQYGDGFYESLSLAVVRTLMDNPPIIAGFPDAERGEGGFGRLEWLGVGGVRIPVDQNATTLVPYRGKEGSFPYVPAADVLHKRIPPAELEGRIILVGTTAPGLMDLRSTPVGAVYPGVEVHANLIAGMLDQTLKEKPTYVMGVELVTVAAFGLILAFWLPFLSPLRSTLATVAAVALLVGGNMWAWQTANLVLPIAPELFMVMLIFVLNMSYGFFIESRAKRQITGLFGQYVPPELVDEMSKNPDNFTMEGESREMTVLFSDVRGFTTISEGMPPKELSKLMNEYMTPMTHIIHKHRGTIDKYIGDAIMAFWGAPIPDVEHARNGVLAALEMQQVLAELRPQFLARGWPEVKIGVGLNTGVMSVGNMGSQFRMAYTVMGDAVNLGSRLEGITKQYGVGILVGETTRAQVKDVVFRELDRVRVKGKDLPVAIYEPLGLENEVSAAAKEELTRFEAALEAYRAQRWDEAEAILRALLEAAPDSHLYPLYLERIAHFRDSPPGESWDGVFVFQTK